MAGGCMSLPTGGRRPRGSQLYVLRRHIFKWIFGVCSFTTYPVVPLRQPTTLIVPPLSLPYHLISVSVTLNQQNGAYRCRALRYFAADCVGLKPLLEETRQ